VGAEKKMIPTDGSGALSGFWNMLGKENGRWVKNRRWLVQSVVWLLLLNGMVTLILYLESDVTIGGAPLTPSGIPMHLDLFFHLMGGMTPFGVMVLIQSDVVGEKQSGTAEWVLSSPLSREAFLLSKLLTNALWIFALLVGLQGIAFNAVLARYGVATVPWPDLAKALGMECLHLAFWLTLTMMLGTFFSGRGPVLGIPIALLILQDLSGLVTIWVPSLPQYMPKRLTEIAVGLAMGEPLSTGVPIVTVVVCSVVFVAVALWRFKKEEF
jgi:ABC-2 type transport system permease protein